MGVGRSFARENGRGEEVAETSLSLNIPTQEVDRLESSKSSREEGIHMLMMKRVVLQVRVALGTPSPHAHYIFHCALT